MKNLDLLLDNLILDSREDLVRYNSLETGASFAEYLKTKIDPETNILESIDVTELTDTMFVKNNYIFNKYFIFKDHTVDRIHFFNISDEDYSNEISKLAVLPSKESDMQLETASTYWRRKIWARILSKDLNVPYNKLDLSNYIHNPDYYEMYDFDDNMRYLEDRFREEDHELPTYTDRTCVVDRTMIKKLHEMCIELIRRRLAMIFEVYPILCAIDDIEDYTYGYNTNCLKEQMAYLTKRYKEINDIFKSYQKATDFETGKEIIIVKNKANYDLLKWIEAGNNDYTLYANGKTTKMYIAEYHKIICKLNDVYGDYDVLDLDLDDYEYVVNNLADYKNEPYAILLNYIHNVIYNEIDNHISKFFALPDIDNYLMRYIQGLNNKRIKLEALKEVEDNENVEDSEEFVLA